MNLERILRNRAARLPVQPNRHSPGVLGTQQEAPGRRIPGGTGQWVQKGLKPTFEATVAAGTSSVRCWPSSSDLVNPESPEHLGRQGHGGGGWGWGLSESKGGKGEGPRVRLPWHQLAPGGQAGGQEEAATAGASGGLTALTGASRKDRRTRGTGKGLLRQAEQRAQLYLP